MRPEAGVDRRDLLRLRVIQLHLASALGDRERLRRWMIRALPAPLRGLVGTDARRNPHARLLVHREAVRAGLRRPDHLIAPVRRGGRRRRIGFARRFRIADLQLDHARRVRLRIHDGQVVAGGLERAVDRSVGVHPRVALVAGNLVVQVVARIRPVPQRDDDVALAALRARRRGLRQLAAGNAISPVGVHRQRALAAHLREAVAHPGARLARLDAAIPRGGAGVEHAKALRNFARRLVAERMAASAAVGVDDVANPLALALASLGEMPLPCGPVPGKSLAGGTCSSENQYSAG